MQNSKNQKFYLPWDLYSLSFVTLLAIFIFLGWQTYPHFVDIFHYLLTSWGYNQGGGYFASSFWDYAPVGRANLYPPFISLLISGLSTIIPSKVLVARLISAATPLIFLLSAWWVIKKIFNPRVSFWVLILIGAAPSFYASLSNNLAASWALIFGLFSFLYFIRKEYLRTIILLALGFYSHTLVFILFFTSLLAYSIYLREYKQTLKIALFTLLLASPFLIHQVRNLESFQPAFAGENVYLQIKPLIYILALWGVVMSWRKKGTTYLIAFLNLIAILMIPLYAYRYFSSQGLFFVILLAAGGGDDLYKKVTAKLKTVSGVCQVKLVTLLLSLMLLLISPLISTSPKRAEFYLFNSVWNNYISRWPASIYEKCFVKDEFRDLAEEIKINTGEKQIIYSNLNIAGVILGSLSGRATANALAQEIKPYRKFDPIKNSRLIIWFKPDKGEDKELNLLTKRYSLLTVKDTPLAYILLNPKAAKNIEIPSPTLTRVHLMILVILILGLWIASRYLPNVHQDE